MCGDSDHDTTMVARGHEVRCLSHFIGDVKYSILDLLVDFPRCVDEGLLHVSSSLG